LWQEDLLVPERQSYGTPGVSSLTPGVSLHGGDYFFFFFAAFFVAKSLTPLRIVTLSP
jgi:hypothetical protein